GIAVSLQYRLPCEKDDQGPGIKRRAPAQTSPCSSISLDSAPPGLYKLQELKLDGGSNISSLIVGVDPGRRNVFTAAIPGKGRENKYILTSRSYQASIGSRSLAQATAESFKKNKHAEAKFAQENISSFKVTSFSLAQQAFTAFLKSSP